MSTINPHDALDDRARTTVHNWPVVTIAWHEPTAPKRVHDAFAALRECLDVVIRLREEFRELRTAAERQERERREAHAPHLAGGPVPKAYKRVDYLASGRTNSWPSRRPTTGPGSCGPSTTPWSRTRRSWRRSGTPW